MDPQGMGKEARVTARAPTLRSLKSQLAQVQVERELLESQVAVAALRRAAAPLREAWGELVDPLEWLNDVPGFYGPGARGQYPYSQIQDREGGKDGPILLTEQDLSQIRGTARVLTEAIPSAIGALTNLTNYVVGTGFTYKAAPVEKEDELAAAVQVAVDQFLEANDWIGDQEREVFWRTRRDGEAFIDFTDTGDGEIQLRIIEPEQVTEPKQLPDYGRCWTFGIDSDSEDVQSVAGYHVQWNTVDPLDYRDACRVEHIKLNTDRNVKRGLSDFYPVHKHFSDADKLNRNMRQGAAVLSAIAMIREHNTGVTQAQAESLRSGAAYQMYAQPTANVGSKTAYAQKIEPGTIMDVPKGQVYKGSPLGENNAGTSFVAIEQAVLRMAGIRWAMPQYLVSGDASNANYSSTMVSESPWTKFCEATQVFYCKRFSRIVWKALRMMEAAGRFRQWVESFAELRARVQLNVTGPRVAVREVTSELARLEKLVAMGIVSDRTVAAEEGYDLEEERADGARKATPPTPFGAGPGAGGPPRPFPESARDRMKSAAALLWEGYPGGAASLREEYDESEHPRDDNGQWVSKGEIASARGSSGKANDLRQRVTDPKQRAKLEKALGTSAGAAKSISGEPNKANKGSTDKGFVLGSKKQKYSTTPVKFDVRQVDDATKELASLFPGAADPKAALSSVIGAPDNATLKIVDYGHYRPMYSDDLPLDARGVRVNVEHSQLAEATYFVGVDKEGKRFMRTEIIRVNSDARGSGFATQMMTRQVEAAVDHGMDYLSLHAAGDKKNAMNGYYTWPRLGFDAPLDSPTGQSEHETRAFADAKAEFPNAKTVLDVFASRDGTEWWKENGADIVNARFELRESSKSMQVFRAYVAHREKRNAA